MACAGVVNEVLATFTNDEGLAKSRELNTRPTEWLGSLLQGFQALEGDGERANQLCTVSVKKARGGHKLLFSPPVSTPRAKKKAERRDAKFNAAIRTVLMLSPSTTAKSK
jgi:hypothetical protein